MIANAAYWALNGRLRSINRRRPGLGTWLQEPLLELGEERCRQPFEVGCAELDGIADIPFGSVLPAKGHEPSVVTLLWAVGIGIAGSRLVSDGVIPPMVPSRDPPL
jgi:hypothetical protein